jgi:hypothetical protein
MKSICLIGFLLAFSIPGFSQRETTQTNFCFEWKYEHKSVFNFHRRKYDCNSGFGVCFRLPCFEGTIVSVPCKDAVSRKDAFVENGRMSFFVLYDGYELSFFFPAALAAEGNFTADDLREFEIGDGDIVLGDEYSGLKLLVPAGLYPVEPQGELLRVRIVPERSEVRID